MNRQQLLEYLQDIEWDNFEVKQAEKELPKSSWETVSAFANTSGGWLVLGVSQQGKKFEITGVEDMEKMEQDLGNTLRSRSKFNTIINPYFKKYNIDVKKVLACFIPSSEVKTVNFNNLINTFIRTGSGDQRASEFEINALYRDQSFGTMSEKTVEGTTVDSLNPSSYKRFRDYLRWRNPDLRYNLMDDDEFNRRLKIVKNDKLTYGGLLFLGKNEEITDLFSDFRVDYLEIPATNYADAEPRYTFRVDEQENLWEYYFVLFQRLRIYVDNPLTIDEMGIGREDTKQADALREALVNLLIHSDYFSPMKPRIRVFTNRIEFENPGMLPRPVEELLKADESLPRNPVLAKFFRIAKLCESAGYGFNRMLEWKKQTGNDVFFETQVDKTKFTFMIDTTIMSKKSGMDIGNSIENDIENSIENDIENDIENSIGNSIENGIENDIENDIENSIGNDIENSIGKLTNNQKKIIENIIHNPYITSKELSKIIGITSDNILVNIAKLKNKGIIRREGADKGGKWIILKTKEI
ncbi:MAG: putative DNA binding domain-containing protein [Prevotellaceae bacterium]|jgi:predicted HTH transcriptional regulator|nr:putative DNA binding domain-containing protein [Prevotellaceae bacterium]